MRYFVLFMVALLSTFSAYARLGDSYQGSTKRFGKALNYFKDKYAEVGLFEYKGFTIFVIYREGRSIEESYMLLAPGIKAKITGQKYFPIYTLDQPENLLPMKEKTRDALRSANLKAKWSLGDKITLNGIEEMTASRDGKKVSGDYYIARKVLVIKDDNPPPAPKAPESDVKLAKSICLPIGSDFDEYMNKFGIPYYISKHKKGYFQFHRYMVTVTFQNDNTDIRCPENLLGCLKSKTSVIVDYEFMDPEFFHKNAYRFEELKEYHNKYRNKNKSKESDRVKYISQKAALVFDILSKTTTIPKNIIETLLKGTTGTKWTIDKPERIGDIRFSTWKNGRKLYAIYNIVIKILTIEFGTKPEDYKPQIIQKLKEKAESEALKGF